LRLNWDYPAGKFVGLLSLAAVGAKTDDIISVGSAAPWAEVSARFARYLFAGLRFTHYYHSTGWRVAGLRCIHGDNGYHRAGTGVGELVGVAGIVC
jgi:hypothetical protein